MKSFNWAPKAAWGVFGAIILCSCTETKTRIPEATTAKAQPVVTAPTGTTSNAVSIPAALPSVDSFAEKAEAFNARLTLPKWEKSANELWLSVYGVMGYTNARLDALAAIPEDERTFANTFRALDDIFVDVYNLNNRLDFVRETFPDKAMRDVAEEAQIMLTQWMIDTDYHAGVYPALKSYLQRTQDLKSAEISLKNEDRKLVEDVMKDYRKAGWELDEAKRDRIHTLRRQLATWEIQFGSNINADQTSVSFIDAELEGVNPDFVKGLPVKDGKRVLMAKRPDHTVMVMTFADRPETRRTFAKARYSVAQDTNTPLMEQAVAARDEIANLLGYHSWIDYRVEEKMVKTRQRAYEFVEGFINVLEPKFKEEIAELTEMKRRATKDPAAGFELSDYNYFNEKLNQEKYNVDSEELKYFFPTDRTMLGMFQVYSRMFNLKFVEVDPGYKWIKDLRLFLVLDSRNEEPLGMIYFDLYPREGKYNHFAQFGLNQGKRGSDGIYERPVVAVVCNFPLPKPGEPAYLSYDNVATFFHEFGHAMHSVLTRAEYGRYSGTSVERDFVEAPSQMLENWTKSTSVLDVFAWKTEANGSITRIDQAKLDAIENAEKAGVGAFMRRQMAFALEDLRLHDQGANKDSASIINDTFAEVYMALPPGSNYNAAFGHLMGGYDAGYYGYAWAEAISADMFSAFAANPKGLLDVELGMRLRDEIYASGGARTAYESIEAFLGRPYVYEPFPNGFQPYLKKLGIVK